MRRFFCIALLIALISASGFAQDSHISLESKVDRAKITIGDRIRYSIIITRGDSVLIEMPEVGANLGAFEILDYEDPEPERVDGNILEKRIYIISTFDTGEFEIPPVNVQFVTKPDTNWQELSTEKIRVQVESLKPSEAGDIKDIKAPLELERDMKRIIQLVVAGAALILLALLIFYFIRRRRQGKSLIPRKEEPPRPAHEIALENLDKLLASDLLEKGDVKQFYIELSDIIRTYIEGRFYIVALEMTTGQLVENMRTEDVASEVIGRVSDFLDSCDLVKFAKYVPLSNETDDVVKQAYELVHRTKIEMEEADSENEEVETDEGYDSGNEEMAETEAREGEVA
ncbi:MAG: hypothetical protein V2J62_05605 [candidate division KSB1 bacterium]|jgi:hypothetical protein|nr:hypothetical protein [candidate division KSB1 bacterium]